MSESTIGDVMSDGKHQALRQVAIGAGILVYVGALLYSGVHNWRLLTEGVTDDMKIWAALGVLALEISAAALPLALHFWCYDHMQRLFAYAFYAVDLGLIILNMILDYAQVTQASGLPAWLESYLLFVVPATPIVAGLGWSILLLLDPAQKERSMIENLRVSTRAILANQIAQQARQADLTDEVNTAAESLARSIVRDTLGVSVSRNTPRPDRRRQAAPAPLPEPAPAAGGNGSAPGIVAYNAESAELPGSAVPLVDLGRVTK